MSTNKKLRKLAETLPQVNIVIDGVKKTTQVYRYGHELIARNYKQRDEHGNLLDPEKQYLVTEAIKENQFKILQDIHKSGGMEAVNNYITKLNGIQYVKSKSRLWRWMIMLAVKISDFIINK